MLRLGKSIMSRQNNKFPYKVGDLLTRGEEEIAIIQILKIVEKSGNLGLPIVKILWLTDCYLGGRFRQARTTENYHMSSILWTNVNKNINNNGIAGV